MLVIREEQFEAFRRAEWQTFVRTIEHEARKLMSSRGNARAAEPLEDAVADAVRLAQSHGFRTRPALLSFASLVVAFGPGWETDAVRATLRDNTLSGDAKLARLAAALNR